MNNTTHPAQRPDTSSLFDILESYHVRYVVVGSVAARVYGVSVQPEDMDIVPACDQANLQRLVTVLLAIEAMPDGQIGQWEIQPGGERTWVDVPLTVEERASYIANWVPHADDMTTIDHRFHTRYGTVDVVLEIAGTYDMLMQRAVPIQVDERRIWVAHIDDLLATLTVPRHKKDSMRVHALRMLQRAGGVPK